MALFANRQPYMYDLCKSMSCRRGRPARTGLEAQEKAEARLGSGYSSQMRCARSGRAPGDTARQREACAFEDPQKEVASQTASVEANFPMHTVLAGRLRKAPKALGAAL
jgi:hypothetical protein